MATVKRGKRGAGRPAKPKGEARDRRVILLLNADELKSVRNFAAAEGLKSLASAARLLVMEALRARVRRNGDRASP